MPQPHSHGPGRPEQGPEHTEAAVGPVVSLRDIAENVFLALPIGVIVFDKSLRATRTNEAATFLARDGDSVSDALAHGTADSQYEQWATELRRVLETRQAKHFEQITHRDETGQERILNLTCSSLVGEGSSEVLGGLLVLVDVTASSGMEKRLVVSERMAAVGKLAARVAHELNNPLDGILRYLGLAERVIRQNEPEKATRYLEQSRGGLLRMAQIVADLLEFSRSAPHSYEDTSLNAIVEEAVKVMSDKATAGHVSVVCSFEERLPGLRGGGNLFQVFCNIIKNAIDAMPEGGTLTVTSTLAGSEALIRFEDTGTGLPDEVERVFEPFFTTKEPGKGTGLGLAICRDIVERYHGRLTADNREQGGARFTVRLPLGSLATPARGGGRPAHGGPFHG
ncbi:MAG: PAS domain-containing protein [Phycisphaerae bacterium]|nr:PAS domain-containing protein [Phycisphaerae bacterium]